MNSQILSGVVVDDRSFDSRKNKTTHYTFIRSRNIQGWKEAQQRGDTETMLKLSEVVDIEDITWGMPNHNNVERPIGGLDLQLYIHELLKKNPLYREPLLEPAIPNSPFRADITVEQKNGKEWTPIIIEVKVSSTFTSQTLNATINQLKTYGQGLKDAKLALVFPGILTDAAKALLQKEGIESWDINYISSVFAKEIKLTPHPILQALYSIHYSAENVWITELQDIGAGRDEWSRYQKFIQRILEHLFGLQLSSPISEHADYFGINRRDFILRNYAETGFWAHLRSRYYADYVVIDAKNYSKKVTKKEILQISNYLKIHGPGLFGIIFSRNGGSNGSYHTCREIWAMDKKMIILLDDEDVKKMVLAKETTNTPEEIIQQKIEQFRLSM
jgi:hypothetical protein